MFLYWCSKFTFNILHSDTANEEVCLKRRDMKDCIWSLTFCQYLKKHILHETSVRSSLKWDVRLGVGLSRNWLVPKMYSLDYCTDIFPYLMKLVQSATGTGSSRTQKIFCPQVIKDQSFMFSSSLTITRQMVQFELKTLIFYYLGTEIPKSCSVLIFRGPPGPVCH